MKLERLYEFISNECSVDKNTLNLNTSIRNDLKLAGFDINDLFFNYVKEFKVNIDDLTLKLYFDEEGFDSIGFIYAFFNDIKIRSPKKDFNLGHLWLGIEKGMLKDCDII